MGDQRGLSVRIRFFLYLKIKFVCFKIDLLLFVLGLIGNSLEYGWINFSCGQTSNSWGLVRIFFFVSVILQVSFKEVQGENFLYFGGGYLGFRCFFVNFLRKNILVRGLGVKGSSKVGLFRILLCLLLSKFFFGFKFIFIYYILRYWRRDFVYYLCVFFFDYFCLQGVLKGVCDIVRGRRNLFLVCFLFIFCWFFIFVCFFQ